MNLSMKRSNCIVLWGQNHEAVKYPGDRLMPDPGTDTVWLKITRRGWTLLKLTDALPLALARIWVDNLSKPGDTLGDFIRRSRRIWSPAKIASDFRHWLMRTHLAIFFADRGGVALRACSLAPSYRCYLPFWKVMWQNSPSWLLGDSQQWA